MRKEPIAAPQAISRMTTAALNLLEALPDAQRSKAMVPFEDEAERRTWHYTPVDRRGLPLAEMDSRQVRLAHELVAAGVSTETYAKVNAIIGLENVLREIEGADSDFDRNPGLYFVTVFGTPEGGGPWGWRFEGHHVSLNFTFLDGKYMAATPSFLGSNPASVGNFEVLRGERFWGEAFTFILTDEQRAKAVINAKPPPDLVSANLAALPEKTLPAPRGPNTPISLSPADQERLALSIAPRGLPASDMDEVQREMLLHLVSHYLGRLPEEASRLERERIESCLDEVHFAWAGEIKRDEPRLGPHYYRIQGPNLLIEYDCVQHSANHIHAVLRDPEGDFGEDLLARHRALHHGSG
jgi:hypothetical protein